ncbi:helix-turn-helix domain-containing protein [Anaerosolibacter sp.]|uniref:helix-turn-helix domain-containing protein n=1 Tax=Anaerosolibacter sp. TaxID=1872527 RepID=UPI0039F0F149
MGKIAETLGNKIRELRKGRGLSQEQLALKAEINPSYLGQVERGQKSPTIDILEKIINALDIGFEELFDFEINSIVHDTTVIDRIIFQLQGRAIEDQEFIYSTIKQLLLWKDRRQD